MTKKIKGKLKRERHMDLDKWAEVLAPRVYNFERMESRLTASIPAFEEMVRGLPNGKVIRNKPGDEPYMFIDNGAKVLAVAHLDATGAEPHFGRVSIKGDEWVLARWLDDRLGVFLILDVLPHFFTYDILLTSGEETGKSSARFFNPPKGREYNWMFEPDRMRTDVVHYQYYSHQMSEAVKAAGFTVYTHGSYSDIAELDDLGCCGINWGIGYEDNHSDWSRANISETLHQTAKFCRFFETNQELVFPYTPKVVVPAKQSGYLPSTTPPSGGKWDSSFGLFKQNQVVKFKPEQVMARITSSAFWDEPTRAYAYWVMIAADQGLTSRHLKVYERELTDILTEAEEDQGHALYKDGRFLGPIPRPGSGVLLPRNVAVAKRVRQEVAYGDTQDLNKTNEGFAFNEDVMAARMCLELEMYDEWLVTSGYEIPWREPHVLTPTFYYGCPVYTDDHKGSHKGVIDCPFPTVIKKEGPYWWVRFEEHDSLGLFVDLIKDERLTLRPKITGAAASGNLPATVTVLSD